MESGFSLLCVAGCAEIIFRLLERFEVRTKESKMALSTTIAEVDPRTPECGLIAKDLARRILSVNRRRARLNGFKLIHWIVNNFGA